MEMGSGEGIEEIDSTLHTDQQPKPQTPGSPLLQLHSSSAHSFRSASLGMGRPAPLGPAKADSKMMTAKSTGDPAIMDYSE
jgi:hypothetical protein